MKKSTLGCLGLLALAITTAASAEVGRMAGTFQVSSTGGATYQIPLWTPSGANGMQPKLTLDYNSDSGNGTLGVGWTLGGLSSIDRCNSTVAQDGSARAVDLTIADRFCLGANRLVLKSGTYGTANSTYRLEIDSDAATITAFSAAGNGPAYFQLKDRNGLTYHYGGTTDARAMLTGVATPISWKLNKITDASGNSLIVQWHATSGSNGFIVPHAIAWGAVSPGSSNYIHVALLVHRADRTDKDSITGRVASHVVRNRFRLEDISIQSHIDGNVNTVRSYFFSYDTSPVTQRSRLTKIQECGPSDCLSPTTINYQAGVSGVGIQASTGLSTSSTLHKQAYDFNGDQRSDLLYVSGSTWSVAFAATGGFSTPYSTGISSTTTPYVERFTNEGQDGILADVGGLWRHYRWSGSGFTSAPTNIGVISVGKNTMADTNGDGLADILGVDGANQVYIRLNTTTGTAPNPTFSGTMTLAATINPWIDQTSAGTVMATSLNKGGLRRSDFDGDGRQDVYHVFPTWGLPSGQALYSRNTTLERGVAAQFTGGDSVAVRMNDDACTDFISGSYVVVMPCANTTASLINLPATPIVVLDWDGDGRTDLAVDNGTTFGIYRSTGVSFGSLEPTSIPYIADRSYFAFDQDGDTLQDIASVGSASPYQFNYFTHTANGSIPQFATNVPDLASSITDGFGIAHSVGYVSTGVGNYDDAPIVPGLKNAFDPKIVVAQLTSSDGTGASYNRTYTYTGGRIDEQRGQFVGFEQKIETDLRNNLVTKQSFHQLFPFAGRLRSDALYQANGVTPIRSKIFGLSSYGGTVPNNFWAHPFVQTVVTREYEIAGAFSGQETTEVAQSFEVDSSTGAISRTYGTTTEVSSGLSSPLQYEFDIRIQQFNDFTNSCFGQPRYITEMRSHDGPEGSMISRLTELDWDTARCRPRWKTIEGNDDDLRVTESYEYDNFGNINRLTVSPIGQPGRVSTANWGNTGQFLRSLTNPLGQTTTFDVDDYTGFVNSVTGPNGVAADRIVYTRDQFGRVKTQTNPDGTSVQITRTECHFSNAYCGLSATDLRYSLTFSLKNTSGTTFRTSKEYFDALDRRRFTETPMLGSTISRVIQNYDSLGRPSSQSAPHVVGGDPVYFTTNYYDLRDRVTLVRRPENEGNTSYNDTVIAYQGLTRTVTDARGKATTYVHNATGAVARVTDADGASTNYRYNAFGDIAKVINAYGVETTYGYNNRGMLTNVTDPDLGGWIYYYYPTGELKAQTDAKGQSANFVYDKLSRLVGRTEPEGTTTFTWDTAANGVGQLASATHSTMAYSESFVYDTRGRRQQMTINADGSTYAYDYGYDVATGQLLTMTYPQSSPGFRFKLRYGYENAIMKSIVNYTGDTVGATFWQADGMNARAQVTLETFGNGLITSSGYDRITGRIDDRTTGPGAGTAIQNFSYVWDPVGSLTQRVDYNSPGNVEDFTYDNLSRLDTMRRNSALVLDMSYDLVGNIMSKTGVGTYTYDPTKKHAVRSTSGTINNTFQYDANGNMSSRNGLTTTWYSYNMPNTINGASMSSQFFYGPSRARWKQRQVSGSAVSTLTYLDRYTERLVTSTVNEFRHYVYGPTGPIAVYKRNYAGTAQSTAYVSTDHLGSSDVMTSTAGSNLVNMSFTPFGERKAADGVSNLTPAQTNAFRNVTRRGFTFHEHIDDLGVIHMNGRVYDPSIGRFLSADPFVPSLYAPQSLNRYSYVLNNPLSATDPSGFMPCPAIFEYDHGGNRYPSHAEDCEEDWDPIPPGWFETPTYGEPTIGGGGGVGGAESAGPATAPTIGIGARLECVMFADEQMGRPDVGDAGDLADAGELAAMSAGAAAAANAGSRSWSAYVGLGALANSGQFRPTPGVVHGASAIMADARAWGALARAGGPVAGAAGVGLDVWSAGTSFFNGNYEDGITESIAAISLATMMRAPQTIPLAGPLYAGAKLNKPLRHNWLQEYCQQGGIPVMDYYRGL